MKTITIRPYPCVMRFTRDRDTFLKERANFTSEPLDLSDAGGCASDFLGNTMHIVGVFDGTAATLAHELAHVVIKVLTHVGLPITPDGSEAFCYLLEDLFNQCQDLTAQ